MKHKFTWLLSVCLFVCSFISHAQTAKLTADIHADCAPIAQVQFTNNSSGFSASARYSINFGDGSNNFSIAANGTATRTYNLPNTYIATLTVTDGGNTYSDTEKIVAYKNPVADFSVNTAKVCANSSVTFTSSSTPGDGAIISYKWDFGDGIIPPATSSPTIQHQYGNPRNPNLTVTLNVTDANGCTNSVPKNAVSILPAPKVSFTVSQTTVCNVNDPVAFTNGTSGGATPTSYLWSFGDGNTSTAANPVYTYGNKGTYYPKLLATSADGCTDTSKLTAITVANSKSGITLPTLLCLNANLTFLDSSLPQTNAPVWLLDGTVVTPSSNVHQYLATFTDTKQHTLQLINNYGTCTDTATKVIQAQAAPVPSPFSVNIAGTCSVPVNATFTDVGAGSTKWEWDFDNANPTVFKPTAFVNNAPHTYTAENTYYVKLRVTDASGCTGEIRQPVIIKKNTTTITSTEGAFGCKTLSTTFKATSTNPVATYQWMFSDDNSTSILDTPRHVFVSVGNYTVKLKVKTTGGCNDSASYKIQIGNEPTFDFELVTPGDTLVCGNKAVYFKVTGDTDKIVGQYYWKFGDVNAYSLQSGPTYYHQYGTDSLYDVSLIIKNHECADTLLKTAFLRVLPPFPKISVNQNNCTNRLQVLFRESSKKAQNYSWNYSDGSPADTYDSAHRLVDVYHTFPKTAPYKVILTTTNGTCTVKDSLYAKVLDNQHPVLTAANATLCSSDSLRTTVSNMQINPWGISYKYTVKAVEYQTGAPFTGAAQLPDAVAAIPFHVNVTGINTAEKSLRLITSSGVYNCPDTTNYISIDVSGPDAGFSVDKSVFCLSEKLFFNDTSKQNGNAAITSWHWFFGDSTEQTLTSGGSIFHTYDKPGNYKAKLVVTDAKNCLDTAYFSGSAITINGPQARFAVAQNPILPNTPEVFTNLTDSGLAIRANNTYHWDFGDTNFSTSNANTVSHTYNLYAFDTVKLVATSPVTGCSDTATSIVEVKNTDLDFDWTYDNPNASCPPLQINFQNKSVNFPVVSWDFGNGSTADNINAPSSIYNKPGTYKITIYGFYDATNYDSSVKYITIKGPSATLEANVVPGCGSKQVIFTAHTQDATSLRWDFQDGYSSSDSVVNHTYTTPNVYTPVLTVKNGPGCVFSYPLQTPITIDSLHISINKDSVIQCHQLLMNFKPAILSVAKNNNEPIEYKWDFGDGVSTSQDDTTSFTYTRPGTYAVTFIANSPYGCTDTATASVTFTDAPHVSIQGPSDFCENTPQTFTAVKTNSGDALTYNWQFENNTSNLQNPPPQTFTAAWRDSIRLIVEYNNCFDTVYHPLIIHSQPQVIAAISDSIVCSGKTISFSAQPSTNNPNDQFSYQWNFGNGVSSSDSVTSYTYPKAGVYSPVLHVDNAGQCSGDFKPVAKMIIDSLNISINKDSVIQCHQLLVNFKPAVYGVAKSNGGTVNYAWDFGDGVSTSQDDTTSFTYTKPALYPVTFTATTVNGCTGTATAQVDYLDPFPVTIQASSNEFCEGTPQTFTAVKDNSSDVLTYDWTFENGTSTLQTPPAQTFTAAWKNDVKLVVDKNGCKDTLYYKVNVHGIPNIAIGLSDSVSCMGKTILFTADNITPLPEPIDYVWNFGSGNTVNQSSASYLYTTAGKYPVTLTATSAFGCAKTVSGSVLINPTPVAAIQVLPDVCAGSAASFKGSSNIAAAQYIWTFSDGSSSSDQNPSKTYISGLIDNVQLIVSAGNCSDTAYQTITVHDLPNAAITGDSRACLGDSAHIEAHNGQTYQWLNAADISNAFVADPFVFPSVDTKYKVKVTDSYGCQNIDSVFITITQPQKISVVSPLSVCAGSKAYLKASGTDQYSWIDGLDLTDTSVSNPSTKDSATTKTYTVIGSDAYGCFTDRTTLDVIVRAKPLVDAGQPVQTVIAGSSIQLAATSDDNNVTWKWTPPTYLSCSDCSSPLGKLRQSVTYTASAKNSYGCTGTDTVHVSVICKEGLVNVPEIFTPNGDGLNDKFHVIAQGLKTIRHIVIYSRSGNKVFERNNVDPYSKDAAWDGTYNSQYMPTGTYIYMIEAQCDAGDIFKLQGTITLVK